MQKQPSDPLSITALTEANCYMPQLCFFPQTFAQPYFFCDAFSDHCHVFNTGQLFSVHRHTRLTFLQDLTLSRLQFTLLVLAFDTSSKHLVTSTLRSLFGILCTSKMLLLSLHSTQSSLVFFFFFLKSLTLKESHKFLATLCLPSA